MHNKQREQPWNGRMKQSAVQSGGAVSFLLTPPIVMLFTARTKLNIPAGSDARHSL